MTISICIVISPRNIFHRQMPVYGVAFPFNQSPFDLARMDNALFGAFVRHCELRFALVRLFLTLAHLMYNVYVNMDTHIKVYIWMYIYIYFNSSLGQLYKI